MRAAIGLVVAASFLAAGCGSDAPPAPKTGEPISLGDPRGGAFPAQPSTGLPAGHPPLDAPPPPKVPAPAPPPAPSGGVTADRFVAPEGWQTEKPSSGMRLLQFRLPRADGDGADGEVAVFPNAMGDRQANLDRWRGQFSGVEHGSDRVEEIAAGESGKVHLLDITGSYSGGMAPGGGGAPAPAPEGKTRMLAAVVEVPAGTYYVKATGPAATMGKWEKTVREFIVESAKKEK
jgi:hypothetical protein